MWVGLCSPLKITDKIGSAIDEPVRQSLMDIFGSVFIGCIKIAALYRTDQHGNLRGLRTLTYMPTITTSWPFINLPKREYLENLRPDDIVIVYVFANYRVLLCNAALHQHYWPNWSREEYSE